MKIDKIYTKTGDKGKTSLFSGERVDKDSPRIKLVGKLDSVNAYLGIAKSYAFSKNEFLVNAIEKIQELLIQQVMACVAYNGVFKKELTFKEDVIVLYESIVRKNKKREIKGWANYGSSGKTAVFLDLATCNVREAEILFIETQKELSNKAFENSLPTDLSEFFNILSKLLFILARFEAS